MNGDEMTAIPRCDEFRSLAEISEPDPRNEAFVIYDSELGDWRPLTLQDLHRELANFQLSDHVPLDIRVQFDTARNILVYSWYVYRFVPIAEFATFACVEYALNKCFDGKVSRCGLKTLLERAISDGLIRDTGFRAFRRGQAFRQSLHINDADSAEFNMEDDPIAYSRHLVEILPKLRNNLAHGSKYLISGGLDKLEICCDVINQLYPDLSGQGD